MPAELERNQPMRLPGRMVAAACIAFIFAAEQAFGVGRCLQELGLRDIARVLFRLREIDGHIEITELR